jgi:mRNA-degrading endonuclease HigB of HigAB toxin-antitoxin module
MKVIGRNKIFENSDLGQHARGVLSLWIQQIKEMSWSNDMQIKECFPQAQLTPPNRITFPFKIANVSLEASVSLSQGIVFIECVNPEK